MAPKQSTRADDGFFVTGKVFDAASRTGVPHLLVAIFDVRHDPEAERDVDLKTLLAQATRVGSVSTDEGGAFTFGYTEVDIAALETGRARLDLMLVVSAPEDEGSHAAEKVLYYTDPPRRKAGRTEYFSIGISRETLKKFSLTGPVSAKESLATYAQFRADEKALGEGVADFHVAAVEKDAKDKESLRSELIKTVATNLALAALPGEVVDVGTKINDKVKAVGEAALTRANNQIQNSRGVPVTLFLTPADRSRLQPFFDGAVDGFTEIPELELGDILFRTNSSENPGTLLVHQNPIARFCMESAFGEKCAKQHTGLANASDSHDSDEDGPEEEQPNDAEPDAVTKDDIPRHAARLIADTPSPDAVLAPTFNAQRATRTSVEEAIDAFSLRTGPAEVPAFYDFHSLQIAFEHVWKHLLDEDLVNATHLLNRKYRQKTGRGLALQFPHHFDHLALTDAHVYGSIPQEVPAEVAAQFDISLTEWTDLSASHQAKLRELASQMATACDPVMVKIGFIEVPRFPPDCEARRQNLQEQGDRLIDAVRHDDYFTLHKTLRELQDRINGSYEFTVFAADRNSHSVNFGLLNTYRQQWTPITYQPGKLIRTVPLSPKEERKYSLKIGRVMKHVKKEAVKNNSSLSGEQASTSRVETEIMAKALNKTDFNLSSSGSYNIGISKGKSTTTFGVEAQQESLGSRKDFREAVIKAAQEYKEERTIEIDTEESESHEYTESGTIVNPNDELSVTYLFYELQRRYRLSEQLYRAVPVVLVAQEVPAPHQITESWVIANDWIINRFLLDDSFRPALQYLANKSVGDDFALRELRKNLRQERHLVSTLRVEMAVAASETENRYQALERAILKRIGEESTERTDGWFSDVGDFFGGGGQDPEAAKARELAAKDAHQYAVEKAEKVGLALRQSIDVLHRLTSQYNDTLRNHLDNETRCKRLLTHLRNNIFHYMQAIWSMEPPDQRFLRLHKVAVPQLDLAQVPSPDVPGGTVPDRRYRVEVSPSEDIFEQFRKPGTTKHRAFLTGRLKSITESKPLVEVADLDALLGFKGNYMIFPLKQHNALTEFMIAPYIDSAFGAMDPDEMSNVNLTDYSRYVCCLHDNLPAVEFEKLKPQLKKWLERLLSDPLRTGDEIVVPTDSLFIETLPGTHPLLENFKLRHRELDVYKAQADVRKAELENLRFVARLLNDEREDPSIDKKILVAGSLTPAIDAND